MGGLRRGLVSLAIAGAVATGGFIGGLALSTPVTLLLIPGIYAAFKLRRPHV